MARSLLGDDSRVILATSPQKPGIKMPTEAELQAALATADAARVDAVDRHRRHASADGARARRRRRRLAPLRWPTLGVTVVRFANGVEAWLKPTDFKNDQVLFTLNAPGGTSLAPPADYPEASLATALVSTVRRRRTQGARPAEGADRQDRVGASRSSASRRTASPAAPRRRSSKPRCSCSTRSSPRPATTPESFALLKRQLDAAVANRGRAPGQVFGEKLAQVNTSDHYTAQPLTPERVATLDREKMIAFYKQRFANAADFSFFMVGAFKVDEALPLLARYVGSLPSTGQPHARSSRTSACISRRPRSRRRSKPAASRAARR